MVLQVDRQEPGREILRWRFVSLALPPGILVAAATQRRGGAFEGVRILDPSFAPDYPVAHQHVHHAAMMSFEELWVRLRRRALVQLGDLVTSLRDPRAFCPGLHRGTCLGGTSDEERAYAGKHPVGRALHMEEWAGLLRQAFIAGRLLDLHEGHVFPLKCCGNRRCREARSRLRAFVAGRPSGYCASRLRYPWPEELLREERRYREAGELSLHPGGADGQAKLIRQETAEESRRLVRAFSHLHPEEPETPDEEYEVLLLQYPASQNRSVRVGRPSAWKARTEAVSGPLSTDQGVRARSGPDATARAEGTWPAGTRN